jgi:hypothetical protein
MPGTVEGWFGPLDVQRRREILPWRPPSSSSSPAVPPDRDGTVFVDVDVDAADCST